MYTITIEDQIYVALKDQAAVEGKAPDELAQAMLSRQLAQKSAVVSKPILSVEERLNLLRSLMEPISDHVDYSRDAIYD